MYLRICAISKGNQFIVIIMGILTIELIASTLVSPPKSLHVCYDGKVLQWYLPFLWISPRNGPLFQMPVLPTLNVSHKIDDEKKLQWYISK
jgi:hypothetical protein